MLNTRLNRLISTTISVLIIFSLCIFAVGCGEGDEMAMMEPVTEQPPAMNDPEPPDVVEDPPIEEKPEISFQQIVFPILARNCIGPGCHSEPAPSGLLLTNYDNFKKGGRSGSPFLPGNSQRSLIVRRISRGGGMPLFQDPLKQQEIQFIKDWIDQGAKDN